MEKKEKERTDKYAYSLVANEYREKNKTGERAKEK